MLTNAQKSLPKPLTAGGAPQRRPEFHPLSIVKMLWKHKLQVIVLWVLLSAVTVAVVYRIPSTYEATATVLVDSQKIPDKFVTSTVNTEVEDRIATLRQEILGPSRLLDLIERLNLYKEQRKNTPEEEVIDKMTKDTKITLERGWTKDRPGAFKITYQGADPRAVARVANEIMDLFIKKNITERKEHAEDTAVFLADRLKSAKDSLDEQEAALAKYKLEHINQLPQQQVSLGATLSRLQLELQGNEDAINRTQQNKLMVENSISASESSIASLVGMLDQSASVVGSTGNPNTPAAWGGTSPGHPAQKESDALEAKLELLRVRYGDEHPEIKRLRAEIAQLRETESKAAAEEAQTTRHTKSGATPSPVAESNTASTRSMSATLADQLVKEREHLGSLKTQLTQANRELEFRTKEREGIVTSIKAYENRLENLPRREQELEKLTRDYEISKEYYRSLLDKKLAAEMSSEMEKRQQAENFTPLEYARVPEIPVKPKRPLLITAGCLAGLLISLVVASGRELKRGSLLGEWELPPGVNVMGRVPWIEIHADGTLSQGPPDGHWWRRGWPLALVSSALISLACAAAAIYLGWVSF